MFVQTIYLNGKHIIMRQYALIKELKVLQGGHKSYIGGAVDYTSTKSGGFY